MVTVFALTTVVITGCPLWYPIKGFILAYEEAMKARCVRSNSPVRILVQSVQLSV